MTAHIDPASTSEEPASITLFEFWTDGHAANFMRIALLAWAERGRGAIRAVVTRRFLRERTETFAGFENISGSLVRWAAIDEEDEAEFEAAREYANRPREVVPDYSRMLHGWKVVNKYARRFPARHYLLMNLESYLLAVGARKEAPGPFSGLMFLPAFLYRDADPVASHRRRVYTALQGRIIRERVLTHPQFRALFVLDPLAAETLEEFAPGRIKLLVDPVPVAGQSPSPAERVALRGKFGVPEGRRLFLLFGDLRARKGLWKLTAALARFSNEELSRVCLAVIGQSETVIEERLSQELEALRSRTPIAVIRRRAYVPDDEMHQWFDCADVALAPYLGHAGSSGVLMLAAAHGVPVLSQDFGQMGRMTRQHRLGVTVNPADIDAFAAALRQFLSDTPLKGFDRERALAYARASSVERFSEALFGTLEGYLSAPEPPRELPQRRAGSE